MVFALTHEELEKLYTGPGLEQYRPEAVLAHSMEGKVLPALCYKLCEKPGADEANPDYAARLREVLGKLEFPPEYIGTLSWRCGCTARCCRWLVLAIYWGERLDSLSEEITMPLPDGIDQDKLAEAALAILSLGTWDEGHGAQAWKSMDWDVLNLLYRKGWITDPVGKQKDLVVTELGMSMAEAYLKKHFSE
jgi:hypothetical protein